MHRLPKLKHLNVVFVVQGRPFKQYFFSLNSQISLHRCNDCVYRGRTITYSVQCMKYHMYFSSLEYTEPDVVYIYGNSGEMSSTDEDDFHSDMSYRNMTSNLSTVLVLVDQTKDLVCQGIRSVNAARPVLQLVSPKSNPFSEVSTHRAAIDSSAALLDENRYFTCLRRK